MKKLLILLIFSAFYVSHSYAEDAVRRRVHMNLWDDRNRLMRFHIGGTLCDGWNGIWSAACEDVLLEDIYGPYWQEIKQVALNFQKAIAQNDYRYLKGNSIIPRESGWLRLNVESEKCKNTMFGCHDQTIRIKNIRMLQKEFLDKIPDDVRREIKNLKYEEIDYNYRNPNLMQFGDKVEISFENQCTKMSFEEMEAGIKQRICNSIPEIRAISLMR